MKKNRSHCPVNFALEIFGDKWTLLIIRDLILFNKKTYGELKNSPEGIATNILANRLSLLEKEGIVVKSKDPNNSKVNIYDLTPKGIDLIPVLLEMSIWGAHHDPNTAAPPAMVKKIETERAAVIAQIKAAIKDPSKNIFKNK